MHKGKAWTRLDQPATVFYEWVLTPPDKVKVIGHSGSTLENSDQIYIGATEGTGPAAIRPRVKYKMYFTEDGVETLWEYWDDSDETPPPGKTKTNVKWYRFTAHKPSDTDKLAVWTFLDCRDINQNPLGP
ncbi:MAG: hypothetical protein IH851_10155 [Armatimonadetes bacterium]|nr:hypothetical protein [Armatimonadota bacterium]